jgi:F420H(2)-dependent quinone reductase
VRDTSVRRWSGFHRWVYQLTGGGLGSRLVGNDMLLLTTRGRKTGADHTVPLLYLSEDETIVLIASFGGRDHHPDWYLNLMEDPSVVARTKDRAMQLIARTASPAERESWWPKVVASYRDYAEYQRRTDREIPIVLLEPAP